MYSQKQKESLNYLTTKTNKPSVVPHGIHEATTATYDQFAYLECKNDATRPKSVDTVHVILVILGGGFDYANEWVTQSCFCLPLL
jgi:hypothetical protein